MSSRSITSHTEVRALQPDKPTLTQAYYSRGIAYARKGNYEQAIDDFTQAIQLKPDYADVYYHRANAYSDKDDYDHAIEDYTKVIQFKTQ